MFIWLDIKFDSLMEIGVYYIMDVKIKKYSIISLVGVFILYIIPFFIGQFKYLISETGYELFKQVITSKGFIISFINTVQFNLIFLPILIILGFLLAYLTDYYDLSIFIQISLIIPIIIPAVSVASFFRKIYLHIPHNKIGSFIILGLIFFWSSLGYVYLIYIISLTNRDKSVEEAASLDGASFFRVFFKITMPLQTNITVFAIIVSLYNSLRIFKYTYVIFGEYPNHYIFMMQNYLYLKLRKLELCELMILADIFLIIIILIIVLVICYQERFKRIINGKVRIKNE